MICEHAKHHLDALVRGEMDAVTAAEVEAHLRECAACRSEAEEARQLATLLRGLQLQAPAGLAERVLAAAPRGRRSWLTPARALAATLILAAVLFLGNEGRRFFTEAGYQDIMALPAARMKLQELPAEHQEAEAGAVTGGDQRFNAAPAGTEAKKDAPAGEATTGEAEAFGGAAAPDRVAPSAGEPAASPAAEEAMYSREQKTLAVPAAAPAPAPPAAPPSPPQPNLEMERSAPVAPAAAAPRAVVDELSVNATTGRAGADAATRAPAQIRSSVDKEKRSRTAGDTAAAMPAAAASAPVRTDTGTR